jgi:hypothetical protein
MTESTASKLLNILYEDYLVSMEALASNYRNQHLRKDFIEIHYEIRNSLYISCKEIKDHYPSLAVRIIKRLMAYHRG